MTCNYLARVRPGFADPVLVAVTSNSKETNFKRIGFVAGSICLVAMETTEVEPMLSKHTEKDKPRDDEDKENGDDKVVNCLYFL